MCESLTRILPKSISTLSLSQVYFASGHYDHAYGFQRDGIHKNVFHGPILFINISLF